MDLYQIVLIYRYQPIKYSMKIDALFPEKKKQKCKKNTQVYNIKESEKKKSWICLFTQIWTKS